VKLKLQFGREPWHESPSMSMRVPPCLRAMLYLWLIAMEPIPLRPITRIPLRPIKARVKSHTASAGDGHSDGLAAAARVRW
jgi:hypothetical protein